MRMECVVATYIFVCDSGKVLDHNKVEAIDGIKNVHLSNDCTNVSFDVHNDNDTAKAQKIRGQLFYAQVPELTPRSC
jgi:hypothetical protein